MAAPYIRPLGAWAAKVRLFLPMNRTCVQFLPDCSLQGPARWRPRPQRAPIAVAPRSAASFYDSVGVSRTSSTTTPPTATGPGSSRACRSWASGNIRDGIYANPTQQWRDWNERYYSAVELAASHGMRFTFVVNPPGVGTGTLDQLLDVAGGRLRNAAEALEAPNEMDKYVGGARWPRALASYERQLHVKAKARRATRSLPILGPSFATSAGSQPGRQPARTGRRRATSTPTPAGSRPTPSTSSPSSSALGSRPAASPSGPPRSASTTPCTRARRTTRRRSPSGPPRSTCCRTFLEQFHAGIRRTFAYELIDEKPDPHGRDAEQHFGLLRNDFSRKPAFNALRNLLTIVGRERRSGRLTPLRIQVSRGERDVRRLCFEGGRQLRGGAVEAVQRVGHQAPEDPRRRLAARHSGAAGGGPGEPCGPRARSRRAQDSYTRTANPPEAGASPLLLHVVPRR